MNGKSMSQAVKVSISLPADILEEADQLREALGTSRSEFFRQAVEAWLRHLNEQKAIARYVRGYQDDPETPEEVEEVAAAGKRVLALEPWE
jgi:metal-responsive CopG/Arc/MetJ family transcriptional regulator